MSFQEKKQIRSFNKIYREMQQNVNACLKRSTCLKYQVRYSQELVDFSLQIESNYDLFAQRNNLLFDEVSLIKKILVGKPALKANNISTVFNYLTTLYSIAKLENKNTVTPEESNSSIVDVVKDIVEVPGKSGFKDLIGDIMADIESQKGNGNFKEDQVLADLLSGNLQTCGIDFKTIIDKTVASIKTKINNGEIDQNEILETSRKLQKGFGKI